MLGFSPLGFEPLGFSATTNQVAPVVAGLSPTQADVQEVLRSFLLAILPAGVEVIEGQDNLVPEPSSSNFVVMTAIRRERLGTNVVDGTDNAFVGSIAGQILSVSGVISGAVAANVPLFGNGVAAGTLVTGFADGLGGVGTYFVSPPQTVAPTTMATGFGARTQATHLIVQLDVHSDDVGTAADMAQTISTMLRDAYAVDFFQAINVAVTPFHADEPRQVPFINDQNQFETRWIVEAHIQADQVVSGVPLQFADSATIVTVEADEPELVP